MKYDEAFKIGSEVDGYVKCTYAILHNAEFGKLFSLQREGLIKQLNFLYNTDEDLTIDAHLPIVTATDYVYTEKENDMVPVYLDREYAAGYIISKLKNAQEIFNKLDYSYYKVLYKVFFCKPLQTGRGGRGKAKTVWTCEYESETKPLVEEFEGNFILWETQDKKSKAHTIKGYTNYEIREEKIYAKAYETLINGIQNDTLFWVKKCAINWQPKNIEYLKAVVNGKEIDLDLAIEQAQKKVDQAKAILGIAAATNII